MSDCREKIIREDCGTVKVGDGKVTFTQCDEELGDITMDQCENTTIDVPCPGDGKLNVTACGTKYVFSANQSTGSNTNIDLDACFEQNSCDDCLVYVPPGGGSARSELYDESQLLLLKFSSDACGICHRMGHYDCTVAEELGLGFECVKDDDVIGLEYYQPVVDVLYPDGDMGFPTYILVEWTDEDNFSVLGEVLGGSDKGIFRERLKAVIEAWNDGVNTYDDDCKDGSGADSGGNCVPETCDKFKWDCTPRDLKVCAGGCYDAYASTHGCNGQCAGSDLQYRWLLSEPGQKNYKVVKDWSRNVRWTIQTGENIQPGKKYDGRIEAKCGDFDGDKKESLVHDFSVEVKECGKQCPGSQFVKIENCPGQPKKAGSKYTLTADVDGLANSGCTFEWYKGGTGGELLKSGGRNMEVDVPANPGGSQKYTVKAIWNQDADCKAVASCTITAKTPAQCSANSDCPPGEICVNGECEPKLECEKNSDCGECQQCNSAGKCVNKCTADEECVDGNCVDKPGAGDCPDGGWQLDYACLADKIGGGGSGGDGGGGGGGGGGSCADVLACLEEGGDDGAGGGGCVKLPRTWLESVTIRADGTGVLPPIAFGVQDGGDQQGWYVGLSCGPNARRFRVKGNQNWDHSLGCGGAPVNDDTDTSDIMVVQVGTNINDKRFFKNRAVNKRDGKAGMEMGYIDPEGTARIFYWENSRLSNSVPVFAADEVDIQNLNFETIVGVLGGISEATEAGPVNFTRSKPEREEDGKSLPYPDVTLDPAELAAINPILAKWAWSTDSYEVLYDEAGEDQGEQLIDNPTAVPTSANHDALIAILMKTVKNLAERVAALENP